MSTLGTHYLDDAVVVITTSRVHRNAGRLVDDYDIIIFVQNANRQGSNWGFVAVECVGDNIAVLDDIVDRSNGLSIDDNGASLYSIFLVLSARTSSSQRCGAAYVVLKRPVPKLAGKDFQQLSASPPFLAIGIVGKVVGVNSPESAFEVIGARPGVGGSGDDSRWRSKRCFLFDGWWGMGSLDESHHGRKGLHAASSQQG